MARRRATARVAPFIASLLLLVGASCAKDDASEPLVEILDSIPAPSNSNWGRLEVGKSCAKESGGSVIPPFASRYADLEASVDADDVLAELSRFLESRSFDLASETPSSLVFEQDEKGPKEPVEVQVFAGDGSVRVIVARTEAFCD